MTISVVLTGLALAARAEEVILPEGKGRELVQHACDDCHSVAVVTRFRMTGERWGYVVADMVLRGADLSAAEIDPAIDYLAKHFGRPQTPEAAPAPDAPLFLAGAIEERKPGKALDIEMGQGRNAAFLDRQGWSVTGFNPLVQRYEDLKTEAWDLIVMADARRFDRLAAERVLRALKPGGLLVYENNNFPGSIKDLFQPLPGAKIVHSESVAGRSDWNVYRQSRTERLVVEKAVD